MANTTETLPTSNDDDDAPMVGAIGLAKSMAHGLRETGSPDRNSDEGPSFSSVARGGRGMVSNPMTGSMDGGRKETGSLDKEADEGPVFSDVGRGGIRRVSTSGVITSRDSVPRLASGLRLAGGRGVRVPDALKDLEFDGALTGADAHQKQKDAVSRVGPLVAALDDGTDEQKAAVLLDLQQIVPQLQRAQFSLDTLVRPLCAKLTKWSFYLQEVAAETLLSISSHSVPPDLLKLVCESAVEVLGTTDVPLSSFESWGNVLASALPKVTWEKKELQKLFLVLDGKAGQTRLNARKLTARLLGFLAVDESDVRDLLLSRAVVLAEEEDVEIRGMIAESMGSIGAVVHTNVIEQELWPTIMQFVQDKDVRVRCAAMKSIAYIATAHKKNNPGAQLFTNLLPVLFLNICTASRNFAVRDMRYLEDDHFLVLEINSMIFGRLIASCYKEIRGSDSRKEAYKAYLAMCTCNSPAIRRHCAYNIPGVASQFVEKYRGEVSALVEFFSNDADAETRWILAAGLHETVKILASRYTVDILYVAVKTLLQDCNGLVRRNTLLHFDEIVSQLAKQRGYASASRLSPLFENLHLQCQGNWRTQELLARQLHHAAPLVPPPTIEANILPLVYKLATQSAFQVRKAGMVAVAACIRHLSDTGGRETAMNAFRQQWALSSMYWMRMDFVTAAEAAVETFSRILFRDTFAAPLLRLAHDPVSNVRLRVAKVIEKVAPATQQMEEFHTAIAALCQDTDVDVRYAMTGIQGRVEQVLKAARGLFEDDLDREEEEQEMYARHLQAQRDVNRRKFTVKETASVVLGKAKEIVRSPTEHETGTVRGPGQSVVLNKPAGVSPNSVLGGGSPSPGKEGGKGFRSRLAGFVSPGKGKKKGND